MQKSSANARLIPSLYRPRSKCDWFASFGPEEYSGGRVPNQNFNVTYLQGEFATGTVGREDVTFAGVTVRNQHVALADRGYVTGQIGLTSGIMGEFFFLSCFAMCQITQQRNDYESNDDRLGTGKFYSHLSGRRSEWR
jgi:hypothetical protein